MDTDQRGVLSDLTHGAQDTDRRGVLSDLKPLAFSDVPAISNLPAVLPAFPPTHSCNPVGTIVGTGRIVFLVEELGSRVGTEVGKTGGRRWMRDAKWLSS